MTMLYDHEPGQGDDEEDRRREPEARALQPRKERPAIESMPTTSATRTRAAGPLLRTANARPSQATPKARSSSRSRAQWNANSATEIPLRTACR